MKILSKIILGLVIVLGISSCIKKDNFPNVPVITFNNLRVNDTGSAILTVNFTDGNGLVGSNATGATPNFYAVPMFDSLNKFYPFIDPLNNDKVMGDTVFEGYVIPDITPSGPNKELSGQIQIVMTSGLWYYRAGQTIEFRIWMVDQLGNHSNTIITPTVVSP